MLVTRTMQIQRCELWNVSVCSQLTVNHIASVRMDMKGKSVAESKEQQHLRSLLLYKLPLQTKREYQVSDSVVENAVSLLVNIVRS
jgi:hypothetical protein